jgi:hypothetical protein
MSQATYSSCPRPTVVLLQLHTIDADFLIRRNTPGLVNMDCLGLHTFRLFRMQLGYTLSKFSERVHYLYCKRGSWEKTGYQFLHNSSWARLLEVYSTDAKMGGGGRGAH